MIQKQHVHVDVDVMSLMRYSLFPAFNNQMHMLATAIEDAVNTVMV